MEEDCYYIETVNHDADIYLPLFYTIFKNSLQGKVVKIASLNLNVTITNPLYNKAIHSGLGPHKAYALMEVDRILAVSKRSKKEEAVKDYQKNIIEVFWVEKCISFKGSDEILDSFSLIKRHKGGANVYCGSMVKRKAVEG